MSIDLKLNSKHDIHIKNSDLVLTNDEENIIQLLNIRLQFFKGEWFLDILAGIPYIDEVLVKDTSLQEIKSIFIKEILDSEGVEELLSFEIGHDSETRVLRIDFSVKANGKTFKDSVEVTI
ncbi:MAG: hypothetical protein U9Q29_02765 [Campylobacterota bacterium]|nr:hypothetical protein [Campylobacterota bacterium]